MLTEGHVLGSSSPTPLCWVAGQTVFLRGDWENWGASLVPFPSCSYPPLPKETHVPRHPTLLLRPNGPCTLGSNPQVILKINLQGLWDLK